MTTPPRILDAPGMACVDLTPLIAKTMSDLQPGEVLAVRTDDPAARVGVPASITARNTCRTISACGS